MKEYLSNLIPRIKEYSLSLDKKELFIEKPWVWLDDQDNQQKLIFKRNGELIMSFNGKVQIGKWEYLQAAKSLLLDRIQDKILLNQAFIDEAVMVLKHDGVKGEKVVFVNEILIPDLKVDSYLKDLFYAKNFVTRFVLDNGENLEIYQANYSPNLTDKPVTIGMREVEDGKYVTKEGNTAVIKSGRLTNLYYLKELVLKDGEKIMIEYPYCEQGFDYRIGNLVYKEDRITPLADGTYSFKTFKSFSVVNGEITKISLFS